jgi:hypothetical protein
MNDVVYQHSAPIIVYVSPEAPLRGGATTGHSTSTDGSYETLLQPYREDPYSNRNPAVSRILLPRKHEITVVDDSGSFLLGLPQNCKVLISRRQGLNCAQ